MPGGRAIGLCGKDGNMVTARKVRGCSDSDGKPGVDLGFVGDPAKVDATVLGTGAGPRADPGARAGRLGRRGETYNVNADTFAGAIAGALRVKRLLLLTDVPGVLDQDKNLIKELRISEIPGADRRRNHHRRDDLPRLKTCIYAIEQGVEGVVILDGKIPHAVLIELLTDHGAGTLITR